MIFSPLPGIEGKDFRIVQRFGENPIDPATHQPVYAQFGMPGHNGIDFAPSYPGQTGVTVHAPHEGYVLLGNQGNKGYGKYVMIQSLPYNNEGSCRKSYLCHLQDFLVKDGQFIAAGDPIGIMGMTGFAKGIHTHLTYKLLQRGIVLPSTRGYNGAIDVLPYLSLWLPDKL